jgi:hypothetical protein
LGRSRIAAIRASGLGYSPPNDRISYARPDVRKGSIQSVPNSLSRSFPGPSIIRASRRSVAALNLIASVPRRHLAALDLVEQLREHRFSRPRSSLRAPLIVPIVQLSPAEAAHMSDPRAETAELGCAMKSRPTVEAATVEASTVELGEAMEATGAKSEAGEPAEGIAVAIIRPIVVTRPALGIVAAARPDAAVTRGERVSGWADRNRSGGARRRSAQHRRGRK